MINLLAALLLSQTAPQPAPPGMIQAHDDYRRLCEDRHPSGFAVYMLAQDYASLESRRSAAKDIISLGLSILIQYPDLMDDDDRTCISRIMTIARQEGFSEGLNEEVQAKLRADGLLP